jgi:hypothetical protein
MPKEKFAEAMELSARISQAVARGNIDSFFSPKDSP